MVDVMSDIHAALINHNDSESARAIISKWLAPAMRAEGRTALARVEGDLNYPKRQLPHNIIPQLNPMLNGIMGVVDADFALRLENVTNNYIEYLRKYAEDNENRRDYLEAAQQLENKLQVYKTTMILGKKAVK